MADHPFAWSMGPCSVDIGEALSIDKTFGDVKLSILLKTADKRFEQTGVYDKIALGYEVKGEIPVGDTTLEDLETLFPGSELSGAALLINESAGLSLRASAAAIIIKPLWEDEALPASSWRTITKAVWWPEMEEASNATGTQSVCMIKFEGLMDEDGVKAIFGAFSS